jgi:hypothetical protein
VKYICEINVEYNRSTGELNEEFCASGKYPYCCDYLERTARGGLRCLLFKKILRREKTIFYEIPGVLRCAECHHVFYPARGSYEGFFPKPEDEEMPGERP